jgi:hypothetical protein
VQEPLTNEQVTSATSGTQPGLTNRELLDLQNQQAGTTSSTGTVVGPRPLNDAVTRIKDAVGDTVDRITKPLKPKAEIKPDQPGAS